MRFLIGTIIIFAASFGGVFYFGSSASAPVSADVISILKTQPEEYSRVYAAFQTIQSDEIGELDRSFIAFGKHQNERALRQDIGGPMLRMIANEVESMRLSGRTRLEKLTRKSLGLVRQYLRYGDDFCDATIAGDYGSATRIITNDIADKDAEKALAEFKQQRFEIAVLALDTIAAGRRNRVSVPSFGEEEMAAALAEAASETQARLLESKNEGRRSCRQSEALMDAALNIANNDMRHRVLALMSGTQ